MGDLKATPGPWAMHPVQRWVSPEADMEMPICALRWATYGEMVEPDLVRANAALIAAAPELYEALQDCANKFWEYVIAHEAKRTPEGDAKAARNREMAALRHRLNVERWPPDSSRTLARPINV